MVEACTRAIAHGRCALVSETLETEQQESPAVAIVAWDDPRGRTARIEVGLRRTARDSWRTRTIEFAPQDAQEERWRSIGLVIATLTGEATSNSDVAPPPPRLEEAPRPRPAALPAIPRRSMQAWADLGVVLAPGLDNGAAQRGVDLRAGWAPTAQPLFISVGARFTGSPRDVSTGVSVAWTTLAAGVGVVTRAASDELRFDARLEGIAERIGASVVASDGTSDSQSRWVGGARLGLDAAWMPSRFLGAVASLEGAYVAGATSVQVRDVPSGTDAPHGFGVAGSLGIRASLP
jgi:hypothetical protein